jgi:hypothetical protein
MCLINGKLYIRDPDETKETPLVVYDSSTLKKDSEATDNIKYEEEEDQEERKDDQPHEKPTTMKPMEKHDPKTGRKMGNGPIFTDGRYLYVVCEKKYIKPEDADEDTPK